jgi:hypothetical protein
MTSNTTPAHSPRVAEKISCIEISARYGDPLAPAEQYAYHAEMLARFGHTADAAALAAWWATAPSNPLA